MAAERTVLSGFSPAAAWRAGVQEISLSLFEPPNPSTIDGVNAATAMHTLRHFLATHDLEPETDLQYMQRLSSK